VRACCLHCEAEHLLFDVDFHGYGSAFCDRALFQPTEQTLLPRPPLVVWQCLNCGSSHHCVVVHIDGINKEEFDGMMRQYDGELTLEQRTELWSESFGWFSLDSTCLHCGLHTENLVSYETDL
jgi:hypothetical protein